jgi:hypothetical protein
MLALRDEVIIKRRRIILSYDQNTRNFVPSYFAPTDNLILRPKYTEFCPLLLCDGGDITCFIIVNAQRVYSTGCHQGTITDTVCWGHRIVSVAVT